MYKLISFDMDGTLLTSRQTVSEESQKAITYAAGKGKEIIFCTGRSIAELGNYENILPEVRYAICVSGSIIYDRKLKKIIYSEEIGQESLMAAIRIALMEDAMVEFLGKDIVIQKDQCENAGHYQMERLQELYLKIGVLVPNVLAFYSANPFPVQKMNICFSSSGARQRTRERVERAGLPLAMKDSEITCLEFTKTGVTKAKGLAWLCGQLGIRIEETIAVGDAENDLDVLMAVGLPIAMGNALPPVRKAVLNKNGKTVSDNDHEGCSEAIYKYLI